MQPSLHVGDSLVNRINLSAADLLLTQDTAEPQQRPTIKSPDPSPIKRIVDRNGNTMTFAYDVYKRLAKVTDANNHTTSYAYFAEGEVPASLGVIVKALKDYDVVKSVTYPGTPAATARGYTTTYTYDAHGNPATVTGPEGSATTLAFDVRGRKVSEQDPNGNTTAYAYNDLDQVTQITHPALTAYSLPSGSSNIETMTYDPVGNLLTQTDRLGLTQTYTYTARNQVAAITRNIGGSKSFGYDENGNLTSETDWKGISFTHTYNALNQRTATTNRLGHGMAMGYDLAGNLTSRTDYNGNTTTFAYDRLSRQTEIHMPDLDGQSVVVTKTYYDEADPAANLHTETDPEGTTTTTTYTYNGRYLRDTRVNAANDTYTWTYDDNGNLSSETDEEGIATSYTYDKQERRIEIHRAGIRMALNTYDSAGNITAVTDARGNTIETDYDQWHRPWQITQPGNITVTANLDAGGNKTYEKDGNNHERTWTYDARGLLLSYTDAESATTAYAYDLNGNNETVTFANTAVTRTTYDAEDRELTVTEAFGSALARTRQVVSRDNNGNPLTVRDFNTNVTTYTYNPLNLVATITDADDKTAEKTYYRTGLVHTGTDRRDNTTTYDYDTLGRVTLVTDALTKTVATTYDGVGNVLTVTDKRGIVTENAYDDFYRLTETKRANTRLVTNEYDDAGNLTAVIDAENNRTEHTYNERNLKTATTFADTTTNAFTYDGNGNLLTATDEANQTTTYTYDNENRQQTVTFAGETTELAYDLMGNKTEEIKPDGNRRTWAYTLLGQLEQVVDDPDTGNLTTRFEYDANGNLRHQYDCRNIHVEYTYDTLNRKTAHIQHKAGGNLTVSFDAYDAEGNLTQMTDAMGRVFTYTYDVLNRQTDSSAPDLGGSMFQTLAVTTVYDANNNVTSITETKTDETGASFTDQTVNTFDNFDRMATTTQRGLLTSYGYDNNGNRTSVTTPAGTTAYTYNSRNRLATATADGTTTYTYYADGKKDTVTYPNGTRADYNYTAADRIETITHSRVGDNSVISSYAYVYDANGNRSEQVEVQNGATETTTYAYDDLDRLTEFTVAGVDTTVTAYTYEGYNRKTETVTVNGTVTKDRAYTYDDSDWLTVIDDTTDTGNPFTIAYTYDNNGNTLTKSNSSLTNQDETFVYNALNRLVETKRGPPAGETILGRYDYNAAGLRVRHLLSERGNVDYYYDDHAVIEEHNADDDGLLAHYRYADRLISLDTGAGKQYYHHDALGSTVNLTTSLGDVQVSYKLDPWGHVREQVGNSVNRQVFTGQEMDENTGLIYFGSRYYDPDTGRFISQDSYLGENGLRRVCIGICMLQQIPYSMLTCMDLITHL